MTKRKLNSLNAIKPVDGLNLDDFRSRFTILAGDMIDIDTRMSVLSDVKEVVEKASFAVWRDASGSLWVMR